MQGEGRAWTIFTAVDLYGNPFLWRIAVPPDDDREPNRWLTSNREAAEEAMKRWVRVTSDRAAGAYVLWEYEGPPREPVWPKETFAELLKIAFKNRLVDKPDHPIILRLRGLA